jgi:hypothetical protein
MIGILEAIPAAVKVAAEGADLLACNARYKT